MISIFDKYVPYLKIKHEWDNINCYTLIELIYLSHLSIDLKNSLGKNIGYCEHMNKRWFIANFTKAHLDKELENWDKISLTDLKEFDILVFTNKKNRPFHFGLYIAQNTFIHLEENSYCCFSLLDSYWRDFIYVAARSREISQKI